MIASVTLSCGGDDEQDDSVGTSVVGKVTEMRSCDDVWGIGNQAPTNPDNADEVTCIDDLQRALGARELTGCKPGTPYDDALPRSGCEDVVKDIV